MIGYQSGVTDCSRCGEKVSAPCFCCAQHCGFYLHKVCAEAPLELNHPFHHDRPLLLMQKPPYSDSDSELEHLTLQHPLISTENSAEELEDVSKCLGCWEPLANDEVKTEHGSYYCSKCTVIFHVKCVMKDKDSYEVENEDEESPDESVSSITKALERNDVEKPQ
ncbi:hypothetical protein Godav_012912 [Gossypium davidsonii]|uniref:DC1 domain-containing protein n=1 Tax=Gossypium davidsonii TaxID=34287 RepID=A0A7J8REY8_GOSDV|nr:hypothetical protein [Gossypium davidsonii]